MYYKLLLGVFCLSTIGIIAFIGNSLLLARRRYLVECRSRRHRKRRHGETSPEPASRGADHSFLVWWLKNYARSLSIACGAYLLVVFGYYLVSPLVAPGSRTSRLAVALPSTSAQQKALLKRYVELSMAAEQHPQDAGIHLTLARMQRDLTMAPKALASYRKVVYLDPDNREAQFELGNQAIAMGKGDLAARQVEELNRRWPRRPEANLLQARIAIGAGRRAEALAQLRTALDKDPGNLDVRILLINSLLKDRAWGESARLAEDSLKQIRGLRSGSVNAAQQLATSGERPNAHTAISLLLAQAQVELRRFAAAEATLSRAAGADLSSPTPLTILGDLLSHREEYSAALSAYEEALKRSPDNPLIINNIASLSADHGFDLERAASLAARMYTKYPQDPAVADTLGWVLYQQRKLEQALPLLQFAAHGAPGNPVARYHYGTALLKNGQTEAGRRELEMALKISREFDGAARARALLGGKG